MQDADPADDLDAENDDTVPYCMVCGENVAIFFGMAGWQHFYGKHAPGSRRELFEASPETGVAWRPVDPDGGAR